MNNSIETIFVLENPAENIVKFATEYEIRYNDIIKQVFGVSNFNDLTMMIQFNKGFQECICERYGISKNKISINQIIHVASKKDLLYLKKQIMENKSMQSNQFSSADKDIPRPFSMVIKLKEGIFKWDEADCSYNQVKAEV